MHLIGRYRSYAILLVPCPDCCCSFTDRDGGLIPMPPRNTRTSTGAPQKVRIAGFDGNLCRQSRRAACFCYSEADVYHVVFAVPRSTSGVAEPRSTSFFSFTQVLGLWGTVGRERNQRSEWTDTDAPYRPKDLTSYIRVYWMV